MRTALCAAALALSLLVYGCGITKVPGHASVEFRLAKELETPGFSQIRVPSLSRNLYISPTPALTEEDIADAEVLRSNIGPAVAIKMTWSGSGKLARLTEENKGEWFLILVDDEILRAPQIQGKVAGGNLLIRGKFTDEEATRLANVLSGRVPGREAMQ